MRLIGLVVVVALAASACTASATAQPRDRFARDVEDSDHCADCDVATSSVVPPTPTSEQVIISGPVRYIDGKGEIELHVDWSQDIVHRDVDVVASAVLDLHLTPSGLWSPDDIDLEYDVEGDVVLDVLSVGCISKWAAEACGLSSVTDAAVTGIAQLSGTSLDISLDWRRFGPARVPGRPSFEIGRWVDASTPGPPVATIVFSDLAESFETSGVIGRPFRIDIVRPGTERVTGVSQFGRGSGSIELSPVR